MNKFLSKGITTLDNHAVRPHAWIYFLWAIMDSKIMCKIGYSVNPEERTSQISNSLPTTPFFLQLLPCLNKQQAKLFEKMLHNHLQSFRTKPKGEWFADPNFFRLNNAIKSKVDEIVLLAETFGYNFELQEINRPGPYPILHDNGYIKAIVDPRER